MSRAGAADDVATVHHHSDTGCFVTVRVLMIVIKYPGMTGGDDAVSGLVSMGFPAHVARHALMRYANDSERALDWLCNVGQEAAAAAAAAAGIGGGSAAAAAPFQESNCPYPKHQRHFL